MTLNIEDLLAPAKAINELTIKNVEKLVNDQVSAVAENTKTGLATLKEAANVSDLNGLNSFVTGQAELARTMAEDLVADAKTNAELGQAYATEVGEILKGAVAA